MLATAYGSSIRTSQSGCLKRVWEYPSKRHAPRQQRKICWSGDTRGRNMLSCCGVWSVSSYILFAGMVGWDPRNSDTEAVDSSRYLIGVVGAARAERPGSQREYAFARY